MSTLLNKIAARQLSDQQITYISTEVTFADNGSPVVVGVLPAGAVIMQPVSGVTTTTAFDAGTLNDVEVGVTGAIAQYGVLLTMAATDFVPLNQAVDFSVSVDTEIIATVTLTGTAATAGVAIVSVGYII